MKRRTVETVEGIIGIIGIGLVAFIGGFLVGQDVNLEDKCLTPRSNASSYSDNIPTLPSGNYVIRIEKE